MLTRDTELVFNTLKAIPAEEGMMMARFTEEQVQRTLADLRRRFPESTEADARTILEDGERQYEDERRFEARDLGACERAALYGTDALDELAAEQDECARFRS